MTTPAGQPDPLQRFYSVPEVAERIGVSENFIRERIRDGRIQAVDLGTSRPKLRIGANEIHAYMTTGRVGHES